MHGNIIDLKGQRFGNLTVLGLTNMRTEKKRNSVWECKCDCGNICYKTGADLRDKRRITWSCGCMTRSKRSFPNRFISKNEVRHKESITNLSESYGVIDLLTAAIMRNNNLDYETASQISEELNGSDCIFDRLIDQIINEKEG